MPDHPPDRAQVCAVVITHHPDAGFADRVQRLAPQVGATLIVDNASSAATVEPLNRLSAAPNVTVLAQSRNLGLARALNIGAQAAAARGFRWALLLDQDSTPHAGMVDALLAAYAATPPSDALAVVGAGYEDPSGQGARALRRSAQTDLWIEVETAITSGSLLSLDAYARIGPFRDDFFIDYVDTEFCLRARAAGYRVVETKRALMKHTVGAPTPHRRWGKVRWTTNHSAERRYYIARNNTVLLRDYDLPGRRRSWLLKSLSRNVRLCKRILFYESDKLVKIMAVIEGWCDAVRGRMGPRRGRPIHR